MNENTLFDRLGGYNGIAAFASDLLPRLQNDAILGRFWAHRGTDGIVREKQLLIDYLCSVTGGAMYYTGRDMKTTHAGMKISENDWTVFLNHAGATMQSLEIPKPECDDIVNFVLSLKDDIID